MTTSIRSKGHRISTIAALSAAAAILAILPRGARAEDGGVEGPPIRLPRPVVVNVASILTQAPAPIGKPASKVVPILAALQAGPDLEEEEAIDAAKLGGAKSPGSRAVIGGGSAKGFVGIDLVTQEKAGTGKYASTGGGLEPPDQALCVGNGVVMEGVNQAFQFFNTNGHALTKPVLLAQFFDAMPANIQGLVGPTSFLSDPKCIYDAQTKRFFATTLEIDEASTGAFTRSHNYIAVSKTSNPLGSWYIYKLDITDDGLMGTPFHATCPCLGDQPLIGADANGFYMSTNEYSDSEVVPLPPPPLLGGVLNKAFSLPDYRNGTAQVYAIPKAALIRGAASPVIQFDTASVPLPADAPLGAVWSSLQPAFQPPGDRTALPKSGVEYFMSQLDFAQTGDNRVAVWALTNTASLKTSKPSLRLTSTIIRTLNATDTYTYAKSADQKPGKIPLAEGCVPTTCNEEKLNANDDRMNQVMLTNGHLWSAVNTLLPAIQEGAEGMNGDPRTGIMYFQVAPSIVGGAVHAKMVRDGYVQIPKQNVLFPSVAASPNGPVVIGFSVSGIGYYPSTGWARLDGLAAGHAPDVHIAGIGKAPEDGFTGYCVQGILSNIGGQCSDEKARWGDYSAGVVDERGCVWLANEYISGIHRDEFAGNWATYVTRVAVPGCS